MDALGKRPQAGAYPAAESQRRGLVSDLAGVVATLTDSLAELRKRLDPVTEVTSAQQAGGAPAPVECDLAVQVRKLRSLDSDVTAIIDSLRI